MCNTNNGKRPDPAAQEARSCVRRPYEKPSILVVPLVAEEVLGVGCKASGSAGPASKVSCMSTSCFANGS